MLAHLSVAVLSLLPTADALARKDGVVSQFPFLMDSCPNKD